MDVQNIACTEVHFCPKVWGFSISQTQYVYVFVHVINFENCDVYREKRMTILEN